MKPTDRVPGRDDQPRGRGLPGAATRRSSCRSARPSSTARTARCSTDTIVPTEVARRVAPKVGARGRAIDRLRAVVPARRVHRRRPPAHPDLHGARRGRGASASRPWASARSCSSTATTTTRYAIAYACANAADRLPDGHARLPDQLLGRADRRRGGRVLRPDERPPRQPGRDVGGDGDRRGARRHRARERRDAAVPRGRQPGRRAHRVLLLDARARSTARRTRAPGATRARRRSSSASATSTSSRRPRMRMLDDVEQDVRGDAAALGALSRPTQAPPRITRRTSRSIVELDEVGALTARRAGRDRSCRAARSGFRLAAATASGSGTPAATRFARRCPGRSRSRPASSFPASVARPSTDLDVESADPSAPIARAGQRERVADEKQPIGAP